MATTTLRRPEVGMALRRLQIAGAFAVVALAGMLVPRLLAQASPYEVSVPVQDAAGLYSGSDVMVAGAKAGRVQSISLERGAALVRMTIDQAQAPLHSDASVSVRPKSLLG